MKFPSADIRKIGVFRALQLGDMLCVVPALRALRYAYPHAEITLLGLPWCVDFCDRFNCYVDSFIHFPGYAGLPEQAVDRNEWPVFVNTVNSWSFDLIIQMQGNGTIVNKMLKDHFSAPLAGFHNEASKMDPEYFLDYPQGIHEIDRHLTLMKHLDIEPRGRFLEFPILNFERENLQMMRLAIESKKYVVVHPGSRGGWRQWPTSHFATLANLCAERGFAVVVTGTKDEMSITGELISKLNCKAIDLTGRTNLGEVGALIREAALLLSNCTGVSHIASATRTPSLVISMDGEPERWGPLDKTLHKTIDWTSHQDMEDIRSQMYDLLKSPLTLS
jgi:ADP-heptose:LPS heptosyltransferase